jgi:hypothetical protein
VYAQVEIDASMSRILSACVPWPLLSLLLLPPALLSLLLLQLLQLLLLLHAKFR